MAGSLQEFSTIPLQTKKAKIFLSPLARKETAPGKSLTDMNEADTNYDMTASCEGSEDLNGKDAAYRNAPMVSAPRTVMKRRVGNALVPMPRQQ